ncbi:MAG: hypothetical protein KKA73_14305 [Chloroflexi bacterium]|nr:hypothetical protein [Chloroflexota bacterium]MBU1748858.1 hypothetical protein [Chloroflexota bacterium]MBU1878868.1 hypothetical protein [Chloroflexota bacterium]
MSDKWDQGEQDEKFDEKRHEKGGGSQDPLGAITGGMVLILIGLGLFAWMQGWISGWAVPLGLFFLGLAAISFIEMLIRLAVPSYRRGISGRLISILVFVLLGLGFLGFEVYGYDIWTFWPLILIAVGVVILLGAIVRALFRR